MLTRLARKQTTAGVVAVVVADEVATAADEAAVVAADEAATAVAADVVTDNKHQRFVCVVQ